MPFLRRLSASLTLAAALCAPAHAASRPWLLVGDIHLDPSARYDTLAPAGHDSDETLLASAVAAMRRVEPDPPVVAITGDLLAHNFRGDALGTMRHIAGAFDHAFPHAQFVVAVGNNDDPCGDYRVGSDTTYLKDLAAIWEPLVDRRGAAPDFAREFARGGYYTVALPGMHVRMVVLNSVLWSWRAEGCAPFPPGSGAAELRWLDKTLAARKHGEGSYIVMHVPPGVDAYSTSLIQGVAVVPFLTHDANTAFIETVGRNRDVVSEIIAGHEHSDDHRNVAGVPLRVVSSISPIYGNAPSFDTFDVGRGVARVRTYALVGDGWVPSPATISHMNAGNRRFFTCAQTELGDGYAACAGVPHRREIAVLAFALVAAAFTSLPLLNLIRRRRRSRIDL